MWGRERATIPSPTSAKAAVRERIETAAAATDWDWAGKRVLDWLRAARVLRQFLSEAEQAEFWGCDIDGPEHRLGESEPQSAAAWSSYPNAPAPAPCRLDGNAFDLVLCGLGLHTHRCALERLAAGAAQDPRSRGHLIASFFSARYVRNLLIGEPYREEAIGMTVRRHWTGEDAWVFHSDWWLREHWGRLF